MASITVSSVAARAVAGRKTFLAGSSRVSAVAPKSAMKARFTVRAADEVRALASPNDARIQPRTGADDRRARANRQPNVPGDPSHRPARARIVDRIAATRPPRGARPVFRRGLPRRGRFIISVGVPPDPRSRASRVRPVHRHHTRHPRPPLTLSPPRSAPPPPRSAGCCPRRGGCPRPRPRPRQEGALQG